MARPSSDRPRSRAPRAPLLVRQIELQRDPSCARPRPVAGAAAGAAPIAAAVPARRCRRGCSGPSRRAARRRATPVASAGTRSRRSVTRRSPRRGVRSARSTSSRALASSHRETTTVSAREVRRDDAAHQVRQLPLVVLLGPRSADLEQRLELLDHPVAHRQRARVLDRHDRLVGEHLDQPQLVEAERRRGPAGTARWRPGTCPRRPAAPRSIDSSMSWRARAPAIALGWWAASATMTPSPDSTTDPVMPDPRRTRRASVVSPWYSAAWWLNATASRVTPSWPRTYTRALS